MVTSEIKLESDVNEIRRNPGNTDTAVFQEILLAMQPGEFCENDRIDINEENSCDEKHENTGKKREKAAQVSYNFENAEDKISEADPNLENSMKICKGIEKMGPHSIAEVMLREQASVPKPLLILVL